MTVQCSVCSSTAKNACSKCRSVYYCSKEHQKDDWKAHKKVCAQLANASNASSGDDGIGSERMAAKSFAKETLPSSFSAMFSKMLSFACPDLDVGQLPDVMKEYFGAYPPDKFATEERKIIQTYLEQMQGLPLFEATIETVDVFKDPMTFMKRWGNPSTQLLRFFEQPHEMGDVFLGGYQEYSFDKVFQSFSNVSRMQVVVEGGHTFVSAGFTDLNLFLNCEYRNVDSRRPIHFVGYDASPVAVAKTLVVKHCLLANVSPKHIAEVWFSLTWSKETLGVFKKAVSDVIVSETVSPEVREVLEHWHKTKAISYEAAVGKIMEDNKTSFDDVSVYLNHAKDRADSTRYALRRSFPVDATDHLFGSVSTFCTPVKFGHHALDETIYYCLPMTKLNEGPWTPLFSKMYQFVVNRLVYLQMLVCNGAIHLDLRHGRIAADNTPLLQEIKQLRPYTMDWSNLVDYMHPSVFHKVAQACSTDETIHSGHSLNWIHRVVGAMILDYPSDRRMSMCETMREAYQNVLEFFGGPYLVTDAYFHPYNLSVYSKKVLFVEHWMEAFFKKCIPKGKEKQVSYLKHPADPLMIFHRAPSEIHFAWNYAGIDMSVGIKY